MGFWRRGERLFWKLTLKFRRQQAQTQRKCQKQNMRRRLSLMGQVKHQANSPKKWRHLHPLRSSSFEVFILHLQDLHPSRFLSFILRYLHPSRSSSFKIFICHPLRSSSFKILVFHPSRPSSSILQDLHPPKSNRNALRSLSQV